MEATLVNTLQGFPKGLIFVILGIVILVLAKLARDVFTKYSIDEEVTKKTNLAVAIRLSGYLIGVVLVFLGALYQPLTLIGTEGLGFDLQLMEEVIRVFLYSLAGIILLNVARPVMDRLILYKFSIEKEILEDQNIGTAAAEFGLNLATGLVIAGAIAGDSGGTELMSALTALAFFGMGLILLILFSLFYQISTPFDIHTEIENNNYAVGIAFGGNLIAIGLISFKALFGDFVGWGESITAFIIYAVLGFILLYILRILIDLLLIPSIKVSQALTTERNVGVAFIESSVVISSALILFLSI
jgi:uncharacterized membrane protein YjfL (UPF0719 family)